MQCLWLQIEECLSWIKYSCRFYAVFIHGETGYRESQRHAARVSTGFVGEYLQCVRRIAGTLCSVGTVSPLLLEFLAASTHGFCFVYLGRRDGDFKCMELVLGTGNAVAARVVKERGVGGYGPDGSTGSGRG